MSDNFEITAFGEVLVDLSISGTGSGNFPAYEALPGGAPANVACALVKWGRRSSFIGPLGKDSLGAMLFATLRDRGVDLSNCPRVSAPTTLAVVSLDASGDRSFSFYWRDTSCTSLARKNRGFGIDGNHRIFHFGSMMMATRNGRRATIDLVRKVRGNGGNIVSFDANYRSFVWKNARSAVAAITWGIKHAHVVKLSEEELFLIANLRDEYKQKQIDDLIGTVRQTLSEMKTLLNGKLVFITLGKHGAIVSWEGVATHVPSPDLKAVDTTGAGDCFMAAILYRLSDLRGEFQSLDQKTVVEWTRSGTSAGSLATQKRGAITAIPSWPEVEELLDKTSEVCRDL